MQPRFLAITSLCLLATSALGQTKVLFLTHSAGFKHGVIRRAKQFILLLVDHFSNFQTAKLIPSEKAADLKEGLIILSEGVRHPGQITIKADNAKGFESLAKNDQDLQQLDINLILADVFNEAVSIHKLLLPVYISNSSQRPAAPPAHRAPLTFPFLGNINN